MPKKNPPGVIDAEFMTKEDHWEAGHDAAVREVLEEVKREDMRLYLKLLEKRPAWAAVVKERAGGPW